MNIEITEEALAELLDHAMTGMQEIGEFTPTCIQVFKELVNKLPKATWNYETLQEFAASLSATVDGDEDYSFTLEPLYDEDDY